MRGSGITPEPYPPFHSLLVVAFLAFPGCELVSAFVAVGADAFPAFGLAGGAGAGTGIEISKR